jgi:glutamate-1-semialdehyde 2,1-aminomutase
MTVFFTAEPVIDYETASRADTGRYARFFHDMLSRGIYLPPSQFEAVFISLAHSQEDIEATILAADKAFQSLK